MNPHPHHGHEWTPARRYATALAIYVIALVARLAILPVEAGFAFLTFYPAVASAFYLCGTGPGWLVTGLSGAAAYIILTPPFWHVGYSLSGAIGLLVFLIAAGFIDRILWRLRLTTRQLRDALDAATRNEQRFHAMLEDQTDIITRVRADGRVLYVNAAWCRYFGIERTAAEGGKLDMAVDPDDKHLVERISGSLSATNAAVTFESRLKGAGGAARWFQFLGRGSFDDEGSLIELQIVGRDITDRKGLESQLALSLAEVTDLYDNAPCGYHSLGSDGTFLHINATALRWMGRCKKEVIGKLKAPDTFSDEGKALFARWFPHLKAEGSVSDLEFDLVDKTGRARRMSLSATALRDADGKFLMTRSVMHDITELTSIKNQLQLVVAKQEQMLAQATRDLRMSEARLRGIFESATDAILTVDQSQTIVMANLAAARMFGEPLDRLVGAPLEGLIPERSRAAHQRHVQLFGERGVSSRHMGGILDLSGLRANGEEFPIDAAISHMDLDGERFYTVILRDITERRKAEKELLAGRATLGAALASMSDAVLICDAEGRFVDFNDAFVAFHRCRSKAECKRKLADHRDVLDMYLSNGQVASMDQWPASRALRGERATEIEYRLRRKDTSATWVGSYSFAPIRTAEGAVVGSVVTARDVTAAKLAQAELEAAHVALQRLVAAQDKVQEDERKRIARELHDDLQQTLAAIMWEAAAIRARLRVALPDVLPALSRIDKLSNAAVFSTRRIVNDLRPQMLEDLGLVAALEALAVRFTGQTTIPCHVEAEEPEGEMQGLSSLAATCLFRVAQESLTNVAKHAGANRVRMQLLPSGSSRLTLRIQDDGRGLGPEDRTKPQSFGLLGMSERVHAIGGTLQIHSEPGAGTTIEVEVPLTGRDGLTTQHPPLIEPP